MGKAKALKKRVVSYTHVDRLPVRLQRMVAQTARMEFIETHTEIEALLLETNLIKTLEPSFNILMKDDKSFPYILVTGNHDYPRLTKYRGAQKSKGAYYGPFPSAGSVNRTITDLQKAFLVRSCTDSEFSKRDRPCLQYHIKRCTAPCVGYVDQDKYLKQVVDLKDFLSGKSRGVQDHLNQEMQEASQDLNFERAAQLRDRIRAMAAILAKQDIGYQSMKDSDIFAVCKEGSHACVQVFFYRGGMAMGNTSYYMKSLQEETEAEIIQAFMPQFYENHPLVGMIYVSHLFEEKQLYEEAFSKKLNKQVSITSPVRGDKKRIVTGALKNAEQALSRWKQQQASQGKAWAAMCQAFSLDEVERVEVYDNSHTGGTNMMGVMVVSGPEGFRKNAYRKFNIKEAGVSDDYGMMREVMRRRFERALKEEKGPGSDDWPDLLLIDGGKGQVSAVIEVLSDLGIEDSLAVVGVAKGEDRDAGREKFVLPSGDVFMLPPSDPALFLIQRLRDEAHRFAIGSHRARRGKAMVTSSLDEIKGIGPKKKKELLAFFGSAKAVAGAGIPDLMKVDGISKTYAELIYNHFHEQG